MSISEVFNETAKLLPENFLSRRLKEAAKYLEQLQRKKSLFAELKHDLEAGRIDQKQACWKIAESVHGEQTRRDGKPYMTHIEAVVEMPSYKPFIPVYTPDQEMLAIVHDCGEDGLWKAEDFRKLGFSEDFCLGFEGITHNNSKEPYFNFIERCSKTIAPAVKLADNEHNWSDKPKPLRAKLYMISSHYLRGVCNGTVEPGSSIAKWAAEKGWYEEELFKKYSSRPVIENYKKPSNVQLPSAPNPLPI